MIAFLEHIRSGAVNVRQGQPGEAALQKESMPKEAENIGEPEKAPAEREDRENEENS